MEAVSSSKNNRKYLLIKIMSYPIRLKSSSTLKWGLQILHISTCPPWLFSHHKQTNGFVEFSVGVVFLQLWFVSYGSEKSPTYTMNYYIRHIVPQSVIFRCLSFRIPSPDSWTGQFELGIDTASSPTQSFNQTIISYRFLWTKVIFMHLWM